MPPKVRKPRAVAKKAPTAVTPKAKTVRKVTNASAAAGPKAKKPRVSNKATSLTGSISHQFDGVEDMDSEGERSDIVMSGGYAWCLWMCRYGGGDHQLFIECLEGDHSPVWHVDLEYTLTIFDAGYGQDFTEENNLFHFYDDIDYVDAKCVITVKEAKGDRFRAKPTSDIFTPNDQIYNCALAIGDMKIHVNKQFLSFHSVFFKDIFFGTGKKGDEKEMNVDGVKPEDFAILLSYLYRMEDSITVHNYDILAKMAKQFQIQDVLDSVEYFLMDHYEVEVWSVGKKIETAEKYGMESYKEVTIEEIDDESMEQLKESSEYNGFSKELKERIEKKAEDIKKKTK